MTLTHHERSALCGGLLVAFLTYFWMLDYKNDAAARAQSLAATEVVDEPETVGLTLKNNETSAEDAVTAERDDVEDMVEVNKVAIEDAGDTDSASQEDQEALVEPPALAEEVTSVTDKTDGIEVAETATDEEPVAESSIDLTDAEAALSDDAPAIDAPAIDEPADQTQSSDADAEEAVEEANVSEESRYEAKDDSEIGAAEAGVEKIEMEAPPSVDSTSTSETIAGPAIEEPAETSADVATEKTPIDSDTTPPVDDEDVTEISTEAEPSTSIESEEQSERTDSELPESVQETEDATPSDAEPADATVESETPVVEVANDKKPQPKPWLGIRMARPTPKVMLIFPDSGAADTEIQVGDTIIAIAGKAVGHTDDVVRELTTRQASETIKVEVQRGEEELSIPIFLGKTRPVAAEK